MPKQSLKKIHKESIYLGGTWVSHSGAAWQVTAKGVQNYLSHKKMARDIDFQYGRKRTLVFCDLILDLYRIS